MAHTVLIVGGGPAGLTAGIYCLRARLAARIVEKAIPGGTMLVTEKIENYPGFPDGVGGMELADRMQRQFLNLGGEIVPGEVVEAAVGPDGRRVRLADGTWLPGDALIVAVGGVRRKLGVEGEERLAGRGVSYCAVCDGFFFRDKRIAVVGGGDSALEEAVYLKRFASACWIIHRRDEFRGSRHLQEALAATPGVAPILSTVVERIEGTDRVERLVLKNVKTGALSELPVDGVFVSIGQDPGTGVFRGLLEMNKAGYIVANERMETSAPGVFACGDARAKGFYQVVTACADGAVAAFFAEKYLDSLR